ncbi:MAG: cytochrome C oxidase subunit IV family protein [Dehalococcoidia bacterium]
MQRAGLASALRLGLLVLIALAVLTVIEYAVGVALDDGNVPYLVIIALLKAGLIVYYFMHIYQLWRQEK